MRFGVLPDGNNSVTFLGTRATKSCSEFSMSKNSLISVLQKGTREKGEKYAVKREKSKEPTTLTLILRVSIVGS